MNQPLRTAILARQPDVAVVRTYCGGRALGQRWTKFLRHGLSYIRQYARDNLINAQRNFGAAGGD
jgi:hypothetical protein